MTPSIASKPRDVTNTLPAEVATGPEREHPGRVWESVLAVVAALLVGSVVLLLLGLGAAITVGTIVRAVAAL